MNRRHFLATASTLTVAGAAGCLSVLGSTQRLEPTDIDTRDDERHFVYGTREDPLLEVSYFDQGDDAAGQYSLLVDLVTPGDDVTITSFSIELSSPGDFTPTIYLEAGPDFDVQSFHGSRGQATLAVDDPGEYGEMTTGATFRIEGEPEATSPTLELTHEVTLEEDGVAGDTYDIADTFTYELS